MADWLLLRIPPDPADPVSWVVVDAHGALVTAPSQATGAALTSAAQGRHVALLVPGSDVVQLQANLPQGNEARLLQLAPYALEDQLSEDVDSMHFALGTRAAKDAPVPVVAVSRALLEAWLARARELEVQPEAVWAEGDLLAEMPGAVTAMLDAGMLTLRQEGQRPLVMPAEDPGLALELLLGPDADLRSVALNVYATPLGWQRHAAGFEALRGKLGSVKVQLATGGALALLAPGITQPGRINLLQGSLRPKLDRGGTLRQWRVAGGLAAALLLIHVGGNLWLLSRMKRSERALDGAITQLLSTAAPGESTSGNWRRRVEARMGAGNQGGMLPMLAAVAAGHDNVPTTKIQSMNFHQGGLDLRVSGPDAHALDQFTQALRASGFSAELASGSASGSQFSGNIAMKGSGS